MSLRTGRPRSSATTSGFFRFQLDDYRLGGSEVERTRRADMKASRSVRRYLIALPIRQKCGPPPYTRSLAKVLGELRRYSAASRGVKYASDTACLAHGPGDLVRAQLAILPGGFCGTRMTDAFRFVSRSRGRSFSGALVRAASTRVLVVDRPQLVPEFRQCRKKALERGDRYLQPFPQEPKLPCIACRWD
jgi:hypothetical protein